MPQGRHSSRPHVTLATLPAQAAAALEVPALKLAPTKASPLKKSELRGPVNRLTPPPSSPPGVVEFVLESDLLCNSRG